MTIIHLTHRHYTPHIKGDDVCAIFVSSPLVLSAVPILGTNTTNTAEVDQPAGAILTLGQISLKKQNRRGPNLTPPLQATNNRT